MSEFDDLIYSAVAYEDVKHNYQPRHARGRHAMPRRGLSVDAVNMIAFGMAVGVTALFCIAFIVLAVMS